MVQFNYVDNGTHRKELDIMVIFATSDLHGNKVLMNRLREVENMADLLLICGDIGGKDIRNKTLQEFSKYQTEDCDYLCGILDKMNIPSRFILGNDDWFEYDSQYHLTQPEEINGVNLIPFEYVLITPFNTNREVNENKLMYEIGKVKADRNSIIVAHTPPYGVGDILLNGTRCGSKSVREWITRTQPKMWLCGHIHENNFADYIGDSLVCNCACWYSDCTLKGWLIDTDKMDYSAVTI